MLTPIVSFPPMKHLNHRNETIFWRNETICFELFFFFFWYERTFCLRGRKALHVGRKAPDAGGKDSGCWGKGSA